MQRLVGKSLAVSGRTPWMIAGLAVSLGACTFAGVRLLLSQMRKRHAQPLAASSTDEVELDLEDSFPASDPPSFTPVTGIGTPRGLKGA